MNLLFWRKPTINTIKDRVISSIANGSKLLRASEDLQKAAFIKKIVKGKDVNKEKKLRREEILHTLKSRTYRKSFYNTLGYNKPIDLIELFEMKLFEVKLFFKNKFHKKTRLELVLDKIKLNDERSLMEKMEKMKGYGIVFDEKRDSGVFDGEEDGKLTKHDIKEVKSYYKEIGDFLKDDSEYQELKKQDQKLAENFLIDYDVKKDTTESSSLYDSYYGNSANGPDDNTNQIVPTNDE